MNQKKSRKLEVVPLSEIKREEVRWLWNPYIPTSKITIIEGDPESGKTFLTLAIAAAVTKGESLPYDIEGGRR